MQVQKAPGLNQPPAVRCLEPAEIRQSDGRTTKAVVVWLSIENAVVKTGARLELGEVVAISMYLDLQHVHALARIQAIGLQEASVVFTAMSQRSRGALTRHVFAMANADRHLKALKLVPPPPANLPGRLVVQWAPSPLEGHFEHDLDRDRHEGRGDHWAGKNDRHVDPSKKWLDKTGLDVERLIAPRN